MKNIATFIIILLPQLSLANSAIDPCADLWPAGIENGEVSITYRISEQCEVVGINIIKSVPNGAFNQMALCEIKRSYPIVQQGSSLKVLSQKEYNQAIEEQRSKSPSRFHRRQIPVSPEDSKRIVLTCYFNKHWELTDYEINNGATVIAVNEQYIQKLPTQKYETKFKLEL